jgi:hypothetical protein
MTRTVNDVIAKYVETRDNIKALSDRHATEMEPLNRFKTLLEGWLLNHLNENQMDSAKTEHGTAFKKDVLAATIDNENDGWTQLMGFVLRQGLDAALAVLEEGDEDDDNDTHTRALAAFLATPELALINRSVNKTAVQEMMEQRDGFVPPGVKVSTLTNLNVRRA